MILFLILIVAAFVAIIGFVFYELHTMLQVLLEKNKYKKPPNIEQYEKNNPDTPPHVLHYMAGKENTLSIIKLCLFKMYADGELLNYETVIEGIYKRLNTFSDMSTVEETSRQLDQYVKKMSSPPNELAGSNSEG